MGFSRDQVRGEGGKDGTVSDFDNRVGLNKSGDPSSTNLKIRVEKSF